jgi:hypothetical protein
MMLDENHMTGGTLAQGARCSDRATVFPFPDQVTIISCVSCQHTRRRIYMKTFQAKKLIPETRIEIGNLNQSQTLLQKKKSLGSSIVCGVFSAIDKLR